MKQRLLLIRHGETTANVVGLLHKKGSGEKLNERGRRQAEQLTSSCLENHVGKIFTSPEIRALETAEIIAKGLGQQKVQIVDELGERNFGEWEEKSWKEVEQSLCNMSLDERYTFVPPEGESWQQMERRMQGVISSIVQENYMCVAIITHEGSLRALVPILEKLPREMSLQYHFDNASITIFDYQDGKFTKH